MSEAINVADDDATIERKIQRSCAKLNDKIQIWRSSKYAYPQNGIGLFIRYAGKNEDVGQAEILSDTDQPLTGENITYS